MLTHDRLDGIASLVGVVEGNGANIVVQDMGFDDTMEELTSDESELSIDGGCGATSVGPGSRGIMRKRGIGVLQEGDGN